MKKFYFIFITLFILTLTNYTNLQIKYNPIFLVKKPYPFVLSTTADDYYYVITAGKSLKINKESGKIEKNISNIFTAYGYIYIVDNSNNNYLYYLNGTFYQIKYNPFISFDKISVSLKSKEGNKKMKVIGGIPKNNDLIIYGYDENKNYLLFSSKSRQYPAEKNINNIEEKLSCKIIENDDYICGIFLMF